MVTATIPALVQLGRIPVQKLFLLAIVLKLISSGLGWWLQMPFLLGLAIPLLIMAAYIVLGWRRRGVDVPDEKFADTCYYLGFIFTITSIIFSLFDLPHIETRLADMAIRFGAAMIATVFGLVARVYLVSFKRDAMDAIETAESSIIAAAEQFRAQLELVSEKFEIYESKVVQATEVAAARVDSALENNARALNGQLDKFFTDLATGLTDQAKLQISTIATTTRRLEAAATVTVDRVGAGLRQLDQELAALLASLRNRVGSTTLPEDHFTAALAEPLQRLQRTANDLAGAITYAEGAIVQSGQALEQQAAKLGQAGDQLQGALSAVDTASKVQSNMQTQLDAHLAALRDVRATLQTVENAIRRVNAPPLPRAIQDTNTLARPQQGAFPLAPDGTRTLELPLVSRDPAGAQMSEPVVLQGAPNQTPQLNTGPASPSPMALATSREGLVQSSASPSGPTAGTAVSPFGTPSPREENSKTSGSTSTQQPSQAPHLPLGGESSR